MADKIFMKIDKGKFIEHVKRICRKNTRNHCKICSVCPFKEYVLEVMRENGWKFPNE